MSSDIHSYMHTYMHSYRLLKMIRYALTIDQVLASIDSRQQSCTIAIPATFVCMYQLEFVTQLT